jgi:hypothetical protein
MKGGMLFLSLILVMISSCGGVDKEQLSESGKNVQIMEGKPYEGCEVIGTVVGENDYGAVQVATNHARNLVAKKGGNYLQVKNDVRNGKKVEIHGLGYTCP